MRKLDTIGGENVCLYVAVAESGCQGRKTECFQTNLVYKGEATEVNACTHLIKFSSSFYTKYGV